MSTDPVADLESAETAAKDAAAAVDAPLASFVTTVAESTAAWVMAQAKEFVTRQNAHSAELGAAKIRELRAKASSLADDARTDISSKLPSVLSGVHLTAAHSRQAHASLYEPATAATLAAQRKLQNLLKEFGYKADSRWHDFEWYDGTEGGSRSEHSGPSVNPPRELVSAVGMSTDAQRKVLELREKVAQFNAANLWGDD